MTTAFEMSAAELKAVEREYFSRSLSDFAKEYWSVNEPNRTLSWNWHLDAICEHLEAVADGEIRRLVICVPPRSGKSTLTSVIWPSWIWARRPAAQFLSISHSYDIAVRDSRKMRSLVTSPEYQRLWPVQLRDDQNAKGSFENSVGGHRTACGMTSNLTGLGGDFVVIDDPLDRSASQSEVERQTAIETLSESISTRLNDPANSAIVLIMQRLAEDDCAGYCIEQGWDRIVLPMRNEVDHPTPSKTTIGWQDPRQTDGELLWPDRFTEQAVVDWERTLGRYGAAGQLQQRPAPRGGGMFLIDRLQTIPEERLPAEFDRAVRYWDRAGTEGGGDYTVGILMARKGDRFFILDMVRGQWSPAKVESRIDHCAAADKARFGHSFKTVLEMEPGSAGKSLADMTKRRLHGHRIEFERPSTSKESRAEPLSIAVENYEVFVKKAEWNRALESELSLFPAGNHVDFVDSASGAYRQLAKPRRKLVYLSA